MFFKGITDSFKGESSSQSEFTKEFIPSYWYLIIKSIFFITIFRYDEHNNNCYDFALGFLNQFLPTNMEPFKKLDFCKNYILPWTIRAAQYIDLFRRVQDAGGVVVERCRR